ATLSSSSCYSSPRSPTLHSLLLLPSPPSSLFLFSFTDTATTQIYTLSLHDALPISPVETRGHRRTASHTGPCAGECARTRVLNLDGYGPVDACAVPRHREQAVPEDTLCRSERSQRIDAARCMEAHAGPGTALHVDRRCRPTGRYRRDPRNSSRRDELRAA